MKASEVVNSGSGLGRRMIFAKEVDHAFPPKLLVAMSCGL